MPERQNTQYAPYPDELESILATMKGPPEIKRISLYDEVRDEAYQGRGVAGGLTLEFLVESEDSYSGRVRRVRHLFPVPAATFNRQSWTRWAFDRMADVRMHELGEYFEVDGEKPYAPLHGPGDNPYVVYEYSTDLQRRTSYQGVVTT